MGVSLGEQELTQEELRQLLAGEEGLVLLKGQWVEVDLIYFLFSLFLILIVGWALFFAVERSSILMRDRWVPRRVAVV